MQLSDLYEASVPPTTYGYWVDPMGEIYAINRMSGHEEFMRSHNMDSAVALRRGWVRMVARHGLVQIEAIVSQVRHSTLRAMMRIARVQNANTYMVDNHTFDGDYTSHTFSDFISFQTAIDQMQSEDA